MKYDYSISYTILKKRCLFVEKGLKDPCNLHHILDFSGVVLAQDENENYIVFASTKCNPIIKYESSEHINPPISENIFETFSDYEDALRLYFYLESIVARIPLFQPSKDVHFFTTSRQRISNTSKVCCKTLAEFMDGVSLVCHVSTVKDSDGYFSYLLK